MPVLRVSPCRNSGRQPGAPAPPNKCGAHHTTSLEPDKASDRKNCGADAHKSHRLFFLTTAQCQHTHQRITIDSANRGRRNKSGEPISISKLTTTQCFTHPVIVTDLREGQNSLCARQQGLKPTSSTENHPHDSEKSHKRFICLGNNHLRTRISRGMANKPRLHLSNLLALFTQNFRDSAKWNRERKDCKSRSSEQSNCRATPV